MTKGKASFNGMEFETEYTLTKVDWTNLDLKFSDFMMYKTNYTFNLDFKFEYTEIPNPSPTYSELATMLIKMYEAPDVKVIQHNPKELGLDLPGVESINEGCPSGHKIPVCGAHTHVIPELPDFHHICFYSKHYWHRWSTLEPSEMFWHEYMHVLTDHAKLVGDDHGEEWQSKAKEIGRPWLAQPQAQLPFEWLLAPPNDGKAYWGDWEEHLKSIARSKEN